MSEWISVDDRLPEIRVWVNVLIDHDDADAVHVILRKHYGKTNRYDVACAYARFIDSEGFADWVTGELSSGSPLGFIEHVTHWMPLPAPPNA